jgi:predicted TIM-barrel fold metal-dependent hydrolase
MSERLVVISSDCHAGASLYGYRDYLPKHWHREFDAWAKTFNDPWVEVEERDIKFGVSSFDSSISWDTEYRQKVLEGDGIAGEIIFPNTAPPFFPAGILTAPIPQTMQEYERRMAGLRAHNTWLAEFCNDLPGRRIGVAQVFLNNIDDALAEVQRIAGLGLKAILLPPDTQAALVSLYPPRLEPLWELCEDLGVIVHKHGNFGGDPNTEEFGPGAGIVGTIENMTWNRRGLAHLIMAGVFERYPGLRFVYTEVLSAWVPEYLAFCDAVFDAAKIPGSGGEFFGGPAVKALKRLPSEYFSTNCWIGASFMSPAEVAMRQQIGLDRLMWGSDLPHSEGTYPYTTEALRAAVADVPLDEVKQMLSGNAAAVYGFDLDQLQTVADVIGPLVSDVQTPLAEAEWPKTPQDTNCPTFYRVKMAGG